MKLVDAPSITSRCRVRMRPNKHQSYGTSLGARGRSAHKQVPCTKGREPRKPRSLPGRRNVGVGLFNTCNIKNTDPKHMLEKSILARSRTKHMDTPAKASQRQLRWMPSVFASNHKPSDIAVQVCLPGPLRYRVG